jgi:hypothetical protein
MRPSVEGNGDKRKEEQMEPPGQPPPLEPIIVPTAPGPPNCCGKAMTSIGSGHAANFDIEVWRCLTCEGHESTFVRVDGKNFWVGAMGRAIRKEQLRIIADYYRMPEVFA